MLIDTALGPIEERHMKKIVDQVDNGIECTITTEYWFSGMLVRRDANIRLKQGLFASSAIQSIG